MHHFANLYSRLHALTPSRMTPAEGTRPMALRSPMQAQEQLSEALARVVDVARAFAKIVESPGFLRKLEKIGRAHQDAVSAGTGIGLDDQLIAAGAEPDQARFMAHVILTLGLRVHAEEQARRELASKLTAISKVATSSPLILSRRAKVLTAFLRSSPRVEEALDEVLSEAEQTLRYENVLAFAELACTRDAQACAALANLACQLVPHLPSPRGRPANPTNATYELFAIELALSGKRLGYTYCPVRDEYVDAGTKAIRKATGIGSFNPAYAHRKRKRAIGE